VHYIPLGSLTPAEADNLVAAGRCIDADLAALSSVRVMGPCIAMGAAAAHALDLAGSGSVHQIDTAALRKRLHDNLERNDPQPKTELSTEERRHAEEKRQTVRTHA
ncbi:MAG: FAD-dependent oxidoreductase, partial [Xanthobacteraceae bacterium]